MYIFKKILSAFGTVFLISFVIFFMFQVIPGDPVLSQLGVEEMHNEKLVKQLQAEFNLDVPVVKRYTNWISNVAKGDLGKSFKYKNDVSSLIYTRLTPTLSLAFISIVVIIIGGIPLGIIIAKYNDKKRGAVFSVISQIFLAIPSFWLAILLLWFFSFKLGLVRTRVVIDWKLPLETLKSIIVPVIAMSLGPIALVLRYVNTSVAEERNQEYVKVAYSKGLTENEVMKKHIIKNSIIPVLTILGLVFVSLLTGSIIIENVFTIQGIGTLLISSIKDNDYPVVQGIVLYYSVVVVVVSFILDIVYSIIDPRIKAN